MLFPDPLVNDTVQLSSASAVTVGHVIGSIEASDSDLGVNSRLSYSMSDEDDLFDVDRQKGDVKLKRALPDRGEQTPVTYLVKVQVASIYFTVLQYTTRVIQAQINTRESKFDNLSSIHKCRALHDASTPNTY